MITLKEIEKINFLDAQNISKIEMLNFSGVSIDSRNVNKTDLFFAIKGDRFDGHDFVADVIANGVGACCVSNDWFRENKNKFKEAIFIAVDDTTKAMGLLSNAYRKTFKIPFIAVAGSNGKTTTKEMLGCVLSQKYHVLKTEGNLNNHIGVPLTLFKVTKEHEVAIIEIGTNHFGEIDYLSHILEPDFAVMTNIGREHLEFFKDVEGVARAEGELFDYMAKAGKFACINGDDKWILKTSSKIKNKITYGFSEGNTIQGIYKGLDTLARPEFEIKYKNTSTKIRLQVPGEHSVSNGLAAFAVGVVLDLTPQQIKKGLEEYRAFSKRMEVSKMKDVTVINDCYNANPDSMLAALKTLSQIKTKGKKIAVLGDMAELGEKSKEAHAEMGDIIGDLGIEYLYTIGEDIQLTYKAATKKIKSAIHFTTKEKLIEHIKSVLEKGDVLMVKASRSMKLEEVIEHVFK